MIRMIIYCMDAETWDFGSDTPVNFELHKSKLAYFGPNSVFLLNYLFFKVKGCLGAKVASKKCALQ